jgi:hypothetical protein
MPPDGPVGSIIRRISSPPLAVAVEAFDAPSAFGPGASRKESHTGALCDLVVALNAAWAARGLDDLIPPDPVTRQGLEVVYGIFDPRDCVVRAGPRGRAGANSARSTFARPPRDLDGLRRLACRLVSESIDRPVMRSRPTPAPGPAGPTRTSVTTVGRTGLP